MTTAADPPAALAERRSALRPGRAPVLAFTHELASDWLPAMRDVVARLEAAQHARIADVGCGQGFSTLALAAAFLDAHVDGVDADAASIADARSRAADAGVDGRVRFVHADAVELEGPYELITMFEALHDMADPVAALRAARAALAAGGTVLVVDEKVAGTLHQLAADAGYARVGVLPVDDDCFRLYRLDV